MSTDLIKKIEIDPIDVCNRKCLFCPRGVGFPNSKRKINSGIAHAINANLQSINYQGSISFAGMGEPLLHKTLEAIIKILTNKLQLQAVTVITNGDYLDADRALKLKAAGVTNLKISMYDENKEAYFKSFLHNFDVTYKHYYNGPDYEVNRNEMYLKPSQYACTRPCFLPFYKMFIDFNGDVFLCVNDWKKTVCGGNLTETGIQKIWESFNEYRDMLKQGRRDIAPCLGCNVYGLREGQESFDQYV